MSSDNRGNRGNVYYGLTQEQRIRVKAELDARCHQAGGALSYNEYYSNRPREGWFIYRQPTTINPPTILRLHKRDGQDRLLQVISITEP